MGRIPNFQSLSKEALKKKTHKLTISETQNFWVPFM